MMKWEYKVKVLPEMELQHIPLNTLGNEGWELVTVVVYEGQRIAYLKRPLDARELLLTQVNESRQAYESGQVQRGNANDFTMTLEDFEAKVLQVIRGNL